MNAPAAGSRPVDMAAHQGWLFDLDGVLTKTVGVHAADWKQSFDKSLVDGAERTSRALAPFDPVADYGRYVDGKPRADGVRNFLAACGIELPKGRRRSRMLGRSWGVGSRKNEMVLEVLCRHRLPAPRQCA